MTDLVVATFNVRTGWGLDGRHLWPLRRPAAQAAVRVLDADVIGLQEAHPFQVRALAKVAPGYEATGEGRSGGGKGEHCALLVRRGRLRLQESRTEWFGGQRGARLPGASYPRVATIAHLHDPESGLELEVINTHLDEHRPENRWEAARQLAAWVTPGRPTVLMGDLNTGRDDSGVFGPLAGAGLRPVEHGTGGTTHQFTGRRDGPEIDHILFSPELEVVEAGVTASERRPFASDHWPLRARLRWVTP